MVNCSDGGLELAAGGRPLRFPAIWLRDNCPCAECMDPGSGQRLTDITDIPNGLVVSAAEEAGERVLVTYAPDRHRSAFTRSWLAAHALGSADGEDGRTEDAKDLWLPADLGPGTGRWPEERWPGYLAEPAARARALEAVLRLGFVFDVLARTPVPFGYTDSATELRASQPLIQLSPRGRVQGVRFNHRSARPLRLPYAEVTAFYAAYRRWAELLGRPERQLNLALAPGDCLILDNTRILHARTAFAVTGGRHLQGCYADLDGLASTLAVLARGDDPPRPPRGGIRRAGRS